jgi:hypothetical protein
MLRTWLPRLKALVLALVLMSGGGGLPVLDVALFHFYAHAGEASPDPGSALALHRTHCTLGTSVAPTTLADGFQVVIPVGCFDFLERPRIARSASMSPLAARLPSPRAPPDPVA